MTGGGASGPGDRLAAVVLAAGYGTRLGALGRDRPKALLEVGGRPVLDRLLDRLGVLDRVDGVLVVTNERFAASLREWRARRSGAVDVEILNDGTTSPEERLGAVGDLALAEERLASRGPVLVAGSDNLFDFPFGGLIRSLEAAPAPDAVITVVEEGSPERLRASGVPELDGDGRVVRFHEKPDQPPEHLLAPPLYLFAAGVLGDVHPYLDGGGDPDAPGHFLEWLVERRRVRAWEAPGGRRDVGTPERLAEARRWAGERAG